jgi:hypothetical protein
MGEATSVDDMTSEASEHSLPNLLSEVTALKATPEITPSLTGFVLIPHTNYLSVGPLAYFTAMIEDGKRWVKEQRQALVAAAYVPPELGQEFNFATEEQISNRLEMYLAWYRQNRRKYTKNDEIRMTDYLTYGGSPASYVSGPPTSKNLYPYARYLTRGDNVCFGNEIPQALSPQKITNLDLHAELLGATVRDKYGPLVIFPLRDDPGSLELLRVISKRRTMEGIMWMGHGDFVCYSSEVVPQRHLLDSCRLFVKLIVSLCKSHTTGNPPPELRMASIYPGGLIFHLPEQMLNLIAQAGINSKYSSNLYKALAISYYLISRAYVTATLGSIATEQAVQKLIGLYERKSVNVTTMYNVMLRLAAHVRPAKFATVTLTADSVGP